MGPVSDAGSPSGGPIFVVGYQHTGTTLVQYMLGENPDVFSVKRESKYFEYLDLTRRRFPDLNGDANRREFIEFVCRAVEHGYPLRDGRTVGGIDVGTLPLGLTAADIEELAERVGDDPVRAFVEVNDRLAMRNGKGRWLEKTPSHVFQLREILKWIPSARAIGLVRDPRDSLASKKQRRERLGTGKPVPEERKKQMQLQLGYDPCLDALALRSAWRAADQVQREFPDRFLSVGYEDLTEAPEEVARSICEFVGLEFDPCMLDVTARGGSKGITTSRIGRWKNILTSAEVAAIQRILAREMDGHGYVVEPQGAMARLGVGALWARSGLELGQKVVRKARMGGPGFVLTVGRNWMRRWRALRT